MSSFKKIGPNSALGPNSVYLLVPSIEAKGGVAEGEGGRGERVGVGGMGGCGNGSIDARLPTI